MKIVKKLYVVYDDGDGHQYLIPEEKYAEFKRDFEQIEYEYDIHGDCEIFNSQVETLLDNFYDSTLEGRFHYVVLDGDIINDGEVK